MADTEKKADEPAKSTTAAEMASDPEEDDLSDLDGTSHVQLLFPTTPNTKENGRRPR
jgi:hypothetical protein